MVGKSVERSWEPAKPMSMRAAIMPTDTHPRMPPPSMTSATLCLSVRSWGFDLRFGFRVDQVEARCDV